MEEGPLSFMHFNPACLLLLVLGFSLLDYMVNTRSANQKEARPSMSSTRSFAGRHRMSRNRSEDETPVARCSGLRQVHLRHRVKVLAGVKRRLDQEF